MNRVPQFLILSLSIFTIPLFPQIKESKEGQNKQIIERVALRESVVYIQKTNALHKEAIRFKNDIQIEKEFKERAITLLGRLRDDLTILNVTMNKEIDPSKKVLIRNKIKQTTYYIEKIEKKKEYYSELIMIDTKKLIQINSEIGREVTSYQSSIKSR